jgi:hypothetical protein
MEAIKLIKRARHEARMEGSDQIVLLLNGALSELNAQQPCQPGELAKWLERYVDSLRDTESPFYVAHDFPRIEIRQKLNEAAARIGQLEGACREIASWTMHSGADEYAKGDYSHSYYLMEKEIFKAKAIAKAALGEEGEDGNS